MGGRKERREAEVSSRSFLPGRARHPAPFQPGGAWQWLPWPHSQREWRPAHSFPVSCHPLPGHILAFVYQLIDWLYSFTTRGDHIPKRTIIWVILTPIPPSYFFPYYAAEKWTPRESVPPALPLPAAPLAGATYIFSNLELYGSITLVLSFRILEGLCLQTFSPQTRGSLLLFENKSEQAKGLIKEKLWFNLKRESQIMI